MTLAASGAAHADSSILTYKGSLDRAGHYVMPGLTYERARGLHIDPSFNATFPGEVFAQPLLWRDPGTGAGLLIVATEQDEVYAFDEKTGAQKWKQKLGEPVRPAGHRCGNIWPLGVTGTPVIDTARATLYLAAAVVRTAPRHEIYAISLADGTVEPGWPVDAATAFGGRFDPRPENQRGALALFGGRVFVPFGGFAGDCREYHGLIAASQRRTPARSRASRPVGGPAASGLPEGSPATERRYSPRPATPFSSRNGATAKRCSALLPTSPARSRTRDTFAPANWKDLDA